MRDTRVAGFRRKGGAWDEKTGGGGEVEMGGSWCGMKGLDVDGTDAGMAASREEARCATSGSPARLVVGMGREAFVG